MSELVDSRQHTATLWLSKELVLSAVIGLFTCQSCRKMFAHAHILVLAPRVPGAEGWLFEHTFGPFPQQRSNFVRWVMPRILWLQHLYIRYALLNSYYKPYLQIK